LKFTSRRSTSSTSSS